MLGIPICPALTALAPSDYANMSKFMTEFNTVAKEREVKALKRETDRLTRSAERRKIHLGYKVESESSLAGKGLDMEIGEDVKDEEDSGQDSDEGVPKTLRWVPVAEKSEIKEEEAKESNQVME